MPHLEHASGAGSACVNIRICGSQRPADPVMGGSIRPAQPHRAPSHPLQRRRLPHTRAAWFEGKELRNGAKSFFFFFFRPGRLCDLPKFASWSLSLLEPREIKVM